MCEVKQRNLQRGQLGHVTEGVWSQGADAVVAQVSGWTQIDRKDIS